MQNSAKVVRTRVFEVVSRLICCLGLASSVGAQTVIDIERQLDFDDPEAWAMKYFTSASVLSTVGAVGELETGAIELGLEVIQIPELSAEQRTVGFGGRKEENLNRSPVSGRVRLRVGLPHGLVGTVGWIPPVEVDGVKSNLVSLALERQVLSKGPWTLSLRVSGQFGETKGDFTCEAGREENFPPGSPENPFGCRAPSSDEVSMEYYGLGVIAGYRPSGDRAPDFHLGVARNHLEMEFQVDAQIFDVIDKTLLLADGETWSLTGGASWQLARQTQLGFEVFYSPLSVQRLNQPPEDDDLLHLRAMLRFRLR